MKSKTFAVGKNGVLGLAVALTLILVLPRLGLAITDQQATDFGESKGLIEAKLSGYLWSHTQDTKNAGKPDYLKAALGEEEFKATIPHSTVQNKKVEFSTLGLKDTTSAYLRGEAAKIILEFGSKDNLQSLLDAAKAEKDYFTQDAIHQSYYQLEIKSAEGADGKEKVVREFFEQCRSKDSFAQGIPMQTFEYLLEEAEDSGMTTVKPILEKLRRDVFNEDESMVKRLEQAENNIDLRNEHKGAALYQEILNGNVTLEDWMLRGLIKENTYINQAYANAILEKLLMPDKESKYNGTQIYQLKEMLERSGFLRMENKNAGFEFKDMVEMPVLSGAVPQPALAPAVVPVGFQPYKIDPSIPGWDIFISQGSKNRIAFAQIDKDYGASGRCLELKDEAAQPNMTTQTLLVSEEVNFSGQPVKSLEFGLSYKMNYPQDSLVLIGEEGLSLLKDGKEEPPGKSNISLRLAITLQNTATGAVTQAESILKEETPYHFNNFEQLQGRYEAPANTIIKSARLYATISGPAHLYLDNIFVRRSEAEFMHSAPEVISATASKQTAYLGERVTLTVVVSVDSPEGTKVSGQWSSNLEGPLGSKVEGITQKDPANPQRSKATLTIQHYFTQDGEHTLFFSPVDNYGMDALTVVNITIIKPELNLSTPNNDLENFVNGALALKLEAPNMTSLPSGQVLYAELQVDGKAVANANTQSYPWDYTSGTPKFNYPLDTTKVSDGQHQLQAVAYLQDSNYNPKAKSDRPDANDERTLRLGPYVSNVLNACFDNNKPDPRPLALIFVESGEGKNPLTLTFTAEYSDGKGKIKSYRWDFGDGQTSTEVKVKHTFTNFEPREKVYNVQLTIVNDKNLSGIDTAQITVPVPELIKAVNVEPKTILLGDKITCSAEVAAFDKGEVTVEVFSHIDKKIGELSLEEKGQPKPGATRTISSNFAIKSEGEHTLTFKAQSKVYGLKQEVKLGQKIKVISLSGISLRLTQPAANCLYPAGGVFAPTETIRLTYADEKISALLVTGNYNLTADGLYMTAPAQAVVVQGNGPDYSVNSAVLLDKLAKLLPRLRNEPETIQLQVRNVKIQRKPNGTAVSFGSNVLPVTVKVSRIIVDPITNFKLEGPVSACYNYPVTFSFANSELGRAKAQSASKITFSRPQLFANGQAVSSGNWGCDLNAMTFWVYANALIPQGKEPPCDGSVYLKLQVENKSGCGQGQAFQSTSDPLTVKIKQHPLPAFKLQSAGIPYSCQEDKLYFELNPNSALVRALHAGDIQIIGQQLYGAPNGPVPADKWGLLINAKPKPPSFWVDAEALRPTGWGLPFDAELTLNLQIKNNTGCGQQTYSLDSERLPITVNISPTHRQAITSVMLGYSKLISENTIELSYAGQPLSQAIDTGAISIIHTEFYLDGKMMGAPWMISDSKRALFIISIFHPEGIRAFSGHKARVKFEIHNNTPCGPKTYDCWSQEFTLPLAGN